MFQCGLLKVLGTFVLKRPRETTSQHSRRSLPIIILFLSIDRHDAQVCQRRRLGPSGLYPATVFRNSLTNTAQAIMAIVVLALSIELTKPLPPTNGSAETEIDAPTTTKYSAFCGGFGLAVAILGIIATFFDAIPAIIVMGADAVSGILLLAGGIVRYTMVDVANLQFLTVIGIRNWPPWG